MAISEDSGNPRGGGQEPGLYLAAIAVGLCAMLVLYASNHGEALLSVIQNNQILQAVMLPAVLGAVAFVCSHISKVIHNKLTSRFYCSITMTNKDENFEAVINFIGKKGIVQTGNMLAETFQKKNKTWKDWRTEFSLGKRTPPRMDERNKFTKPFINSVGRSFIDTFYSLQICITCFGYRIGCTKVM